MKRELYQEMVNLDKHLDEMMAIAVNARNDQYILEQRVDNIKSVLEVHAVHL